jgi:hypothetical protein
MENMVEAPARFDSKATTLDFGVCAKGILSLFVEKSSLQHFRKFPVPFRGESICKRLNLRGGSARDSRTEAGFCKIPCLFPC